MKMTKSMLSVFFLTLYYFCIRVYRYIECGYQRFLIIREYEYVPHKQTQKNIYLTKRLTIVVLLYIYLLYLFKINGIPAILWAAYKGCTHHVFCIRANEVLK